MTKIVRICFAFIFSNFCYKLSIRFFSTYTPYKFSFVYKITTKKPNYSSHQSHQSHIFARTARTPTSLTRPTSLTSLPVRLALPLALPQKFFSLLLHYTHHIQTIQEERTKSEKSAKYKHLIKVPKVVCFTFQLC